MEPQQVSQLLQKTFSNLEMTSGANNQDPWIEEGLDENEISEALNTAKREKYFRLKSRREAESHRNWLQAWLSPWTPVDMKKYISWRAKLFGFSTNDGVDGKKIFRIDEANCDLVMALCYYFANDPAFEQICVPDALGQPKPMNWKLNKGLLITGNVGTGKTMVMKLLQVNKKQCFEVLNAADISQQFARTNEQGGYEIISSMSTIHKTEIKHRNFFFHEDWGLCIDDVGVEDQKSNFGNRANVIAEILAGRYAANLKPGMTHMTTNLGKVGLEEKYGPRIWSRMMEMFNVIQLGGADRRL